MKEERLIKLTQLNEPVFQNIDRSKLVSLAISNYTEEIHKCSWQMFVDLGIFTDQDTKAPLVERNLGYGSCMTSLSKERSYIVSGLPDEIKKPINHIFDQIFEFNEYYHQLTNINPIKEINYGQTENTTSPSSLTKEAIEDIIARGGKIIYDRNDSLISHLAPEKALESTLYLNNKAHFHRLLESSNLKAPETYILSLTFDEINVILDDESKVKENFFTLLSAKYAQFNININYFLKVSIGAGGIGLIRSESSNEDFVSMLKFYKGTKERNSEVEILVAKPLDIVQLPQLDPLDPNNTIAFSPCMTMAMSKDDFILRQAAEQVLKNGTAYVGSMWDINMQENLLSVLDKRFFEFGRLIQSTGYTGILGTDYILTQKENGPSKISMEEIRELNRLEGRIKTKALQAMFDYTLIGDLNARQNGNCVGEKVKRSLMLNGVQITKTFQSKKTLESTPDQTIENLNNQFGSMKLRSIDNQISGVVVIPDLTTKYENELTVTTVFINPQLQEKEFYKLLEMK